MKKEKQLIMKNLKKKALVTGAAIVVSLTMVTGVSADTQSNDVDIEIEGGEVSLETSAIETFGTIVLEATPQTYETSFENDFTVTDLSGTHEGWRVDVSASHFLNGEDILPEGSLSLDPVSNIERVGTGYGSLPVKSMETNTIIDSGTNTVVEAEEGSGMGVFDITFPTDALSLTVDATIAKAGEYESTLTWDLISAP